MNSRCTLLLVTLVGITWVASAAPYFRLHHELPVCLAEELSSRNEVVVVEYTRRHTASSLDLGVAVKITSPLTKTVVYEQFLRDSQGSFTMRPLSSENGEYDFCFSLVGGDSTSDRFVELSVMLDHHDRKHTLTTPAPAFTRQKTATGEEVFVFTDTDGQQKETLRTHDYLDRIQAVLTNVGGSIEEIHTEMKAFEARTNRMRTTSESTFDRVWGFAVVTIAVLLVMSWLQLALLKQFLRRKKLV